MMNFIKATCLDETGKRYPDSCAYYECDRCGFRVKEFESGRTEFPDNDEWEQIVIEN